jgi:hypothetical protein
MCTSMGASLPPKVQESAVTALYNVLSFVQTNFSDERAAERTAIMQAVCTATQAPSAEVKQKAFECIQ